MTTAQADSKGRVTLGRRFAGKTVIIQERDETSVTVTAATVIPEREAWLFRNPKALAAVRRGLAEAAEGRFAEGPDLSADRRLAEKLEG